MRTPIGRGAASALRLDAEDIARIEAPDPDPGLPSVLDVSGMLGDCVGLATLAAVELQRVRGLLADRGPVRVDGARIATAVRSERHFRIDGQAPEAWAPLSGFFETSDGWVRTHANYPHHAERLRRSLGLPSTADREDLAAAVAQRAAHELEDLAAEVGAVVGAVRSPEEWDDHPQAIATHDVPVLEWSETAGGRPRPWSRSGGGPLSGVRVLDLTRVLAGPVATRNLALLGADVLRVDSPRLPETAWIHLDTGAGKRSTTLDLASRADRAVLESLLTTADVVVTGYRPGSLSAFGLDAEQLAQRHEGLVVASVSAWGTRGPWADRRGFDSIVQAVSGIAVLSRGDEAAPGVLPAQALDHAAGHLMTAGVLRALAEQRTTGAATRIGVSLLAVARELRRTQGVTHAETPEPTVQSAPTPAGVITCAAPALVGPNIPDLYPRLATPWGEDQPGWLARS